MTRLARLVATTLSGFVILAAAPAALAHGASKGLHLHGPGGPIKPSQLVVVQADAAEPLTFLKISFVTGRAATVVPEKPVKHIEAKVRAPGTFQGKTLSLHAEGRTTTGTVVRASLVVPVEGEVHALGEPGR